MSIVIDVLYVKMIERSIHRKLSNKEMATLRNGEPIFVRNKYGTWMSFRAPLYRFPYDVMPKDTDARAIEERTNNGNIFEHAFTVGPIKKASNG